MTPVGEGRSRHYHATGAFDLSLCLNAETPEPCGAGVSVNASCGGPLQGFPETRVPFAVAISLGRGKRVSTAVRGPVGHDEAGGRSPSGGAAPEGRERP